MINQNKNHEFLPKIPPNQFILVSFKKRLFSFEDHHHHGPQETWSQDVLERRDSERIIVVPGLVNIQKASKNYGKIHHVQWVNQLFLWQLSIANWDIIKKIANNPTLIIPLVLLINIINWHNISQTYLHKIPLPSGKHTKNCGKSTHFLWVNQLFLWPWLPVRKL